MNAFPGPLAVASALPGPVALAAPSLGQADVDKGVVLGTVAGVTLVGTAWYAGVSFLGFRAASRETGFPRAMGYVVGIGGALTGAVLLVTGLGAMGGVAQANVV